ncbi:MAG TPA: anhydro-N-acetylmuramic acid kinase [Thermohalobaculum sp.]|nr:anhydro-N-acetylmuramic acid kinase [Thermohalobaculum sp.]
MEAGGPVWALGLMSGTSLDGVDAALVRTDGERVVEIGPGRELPYAPGAPAFVAEVWRDWGAFRPPASERHGATLAEAGAEVDVQHAQAAAGLIARTGVAPVVVGYHGQTVAHAPEQGWTWQLGCGGRLARALNRTVVWDFRTADMAAGGQGAPLAPFYHFALARLLGAEEPVAFVNIGGVANVTWVDPRKPAPEADGALIAFDTGPGNALVDDWMQRRTGEALDRDGATAARGEVDWTTVRSNAAGAFIERAPPKSLDRNEFALALDRVQNLSTEDGAATLTALTVETIAESLRHMPVAPARWLICGGGRRNRFLMARLAGRLDQPVVDVDEVGLDGDMLEAQAFAHLAVRVLRGLPTSAPGTTGCAEPVSGGRISRPE